jgi:nitroreductase
MEFAEVVRRRRMVRNYTDEPVDPAAVERMLEHATRAPSAGFSQGWSFLVLDRLEDVERFWAAATPSSPSDVAENSWLTGMRRAPVVVVPLACERAYLERYAEPDKGAIAPDEQVWSVPYWYVDTGMASLLILLTAVDEGLAACFFGIPAERVESFRAEFGVPDDHTPVGAITLGHGAPDRRSPSLRRGRHGVEQVVHRGHW